MNYQTILKFGIIFMFSSSATALTYHEALSIAEIESQEIKVLKLESESAGWSQIKAIAGYLPKISLDGRHLFDERFEELEVAFGGSLFVMPTIQPYSSLGATVTWNIFNSFETTHEMWATQFEKKAADDRLDQALKLKRVQIRTLFYHALGSQTLVEVAKQNTTTLESHVNDIKSRLRAGVSTRFDLLRAEVQLEEAQTEKIADQNEVIISRGKLFEAMGVKDEGAPLVGKMSEDFSNIDINKMTLNLEGRKDRSAILAERDRLQEMSSVATAHWGPSISLFGHYSWYNNFNRSVNEEDERFKSAYALGVQFQWNLFDGGASYASQRQAVLKHQIAEAKLNQFERDMATEIEKSKLHFSYSVINYNAKISSMKKADEAVRLARSGLRAGVRTNTEVLDAVVDWNRTQASVVQAQIEVIEALGQLELILGQTI